MSFLSRTLHPVARTFNDLAIWKGERRVWGLRMAASSFERWLYLQAHRCGVMGRSDQSFIEQAISPGMRILDVGSNIGLYSIAMARRIGPSGHMICFEPDPQLFAAFRCNCAANQITNIEAYNLALGSSRHRLTLHKSTINSGDNHLGTATIAGAFREGVAVDVVSLDEHLPNQTVDFVKIDVQGWETEALRGMQQTLAANPAIKVYFEFSPYNLRRAGSSYGELVDFLRHLDFRIHHPGRGVDLDRSAIDQLAGSLPGLRYTNLLATR